MPQLILQVDEGQAAYLSLAEIPKPENLEQNYMASFHFVTFYSDLSYSNRSIRTEFGT
jgi:hypothetical protein